MSWLEVHTIKLAVWALGKLLKTVKNKEKKLASINTIEYQDQFSKMTNIDEKNYEHKFRIQTFIFINITMYMHNEEREWGEKELVMRKQ